MLLEGETYSLGRTSRLVLPDGAEAILRSGASEVPLEGPLDVRLR